jgi:hypothetical protein
MRGPEEGVAIFVLVRRLRWPGLCDLLTQLERAEIARGRAIVYVGRCRALEKDSTEKEKVYGR